MEKPVRSSLQYLSISYEFVLAIGNSLNLSEMLHEVIHKIVHKTNAHRGIIWVKNGEKKLQPVASAGINIEDVLAQGEIEDLRDVLNQIQKRQQFLLGYKDDKDFLQYCPILTEKEESVLIVPVTNVAILHLVYASREIADEPLANLLASLSKKLSVAIEACTAHKNIINEVQVRVEAEKELEKKTERLISSEKELQRLLGESEQARKSLLSILEDVAQKEEALKESNENFQQVVSNITTIIWKADIANDGTFKNTYTSPVGDELLELPAGTLQNDWDKYFRYIKPEYLERVYNAFREAIKSPGKLIDCEYEVLKDNGQTAWFHSKGRCFEKNGKLHVFGSTIDITERKRAEKELEIRNRISEIFLTIPDEEVYAEVLKIVMEALESKYGTFGYFNDDGAFVAPAMTREIYWEKCRVPDKEIIFERGTFKGIWDKAIKDKKTRYSNNGPFKTPKGHIQIKNTLVTPIVYRNKVISAIHLANNPAGYNEKDQILLETIVNHIAPILYARLQREREEESRKKAEEALRESEDRFRGLFENMSSGVAVYEAVDNGGDFVFKDFNKAGERISNASIDDIIGRRVIEVFPNVREFGLFDVFQRVWRTGKPEHHPTSLYKDDHIAHWAENYVYKLPSGEIVAIYDDITDRKQAEEQIEASLSEKETLLKEIHHRVKNNFQIIISLLALQEKRIKDEELLEIYRNSQNRIKSMALVHERLYQSEDFTRIKFDDYIKTIATELYRISLCDPNRIDLDFKVRKIQLNLDQAIPCGLIINELVSNAVKHAFPPELRRKGKISISLKEKDNTVELTVKDNGVGIPDEIDIEKVDSLGLKLVPLLAERQLNGKLKLERKKGTKFTIRFQKDV